MLQLLEVNCIGTWTLRQTEAAFGVPRDGADGVATTAAGCTGAGWVACCPAIDTFLIAVAKEIRLKHMGPETLHVYIYICTYTQKGYIYISIYTCLHYITLHYSTVQYSTVQYSTVQYSSLHYITLHYTTLHYITLHDITSHYMT